MTKVSTLQVKRSFQGSYEDDSPGNIRDNSKTF